MNWKHDLGLLILRVGVAGLMITHGYDKLAQFSAMSAHFPDPLGVGNSVSLALTVFAEFFCALALILGLFTRYVSLPLIITMGVAALMIHGSDPLSKKEPALLYLIPFVALSLLGAGKYSLDGLLGRNK